MRPRASLPVALEDRSRLMPQGTGEKSVRGWKKCQEPIREGNSRESVPGAFPGFRPPAGRRGCACSSPPCFVVGRVVEVDRRETQRHRFGQPTSAARRVARDQPGALNRSGEAASWERVSCSTLTLGGLHGRRPLPEPTCTPRTISRPGARAITTLSILAPPLALQRHGFAVPPEPHAAAGQVPAAEP